MQKKNYQFLLLFLFVFGLQAQNSNKIDSLKHIISTKKDSALVWAYHDLAKIYMSDSTKYAISILKEGLTKADVIGYPYGKAWLYEKLGIIQDIKGNTDSALHYYNLGTKSLETAQAQPSDFVYMIINKGVAYYYAGDMTKALNHYLEAEKICSDHNLKKLHSSVLNNLGAVYRHLVDYKNAIGIYEKSLVIKKELNDREGVANVYLNMGLANGYLNNHDQAANLLFEAREIYRDLGKEKEVQSTNISLGLTYYRLNQYDKAALLLEQSLIALGDEIRLQNEIPAKLGLGVIYKEKKEYEKALDYLKQANTKATPTGLTDYKIEIANELSQVYENLNQHGEALIHLKTFNVLSDSLAQIKNETLLQEMAAKYKSELQEEKIVNQNLKILKDRREKIALFASIGALIIVLGLLYRLFRIRQKANKKLNAQKHIIETSLKEKETLLKEIHHRVKNNLQIISSLLSIQSGGITDKKALEAIKEGKSRVHSMALIHQNLYQDNDLVHIDIAEYIEKLSESLKDNYLLRDSQIKINTDIEHLKLDVDTVIPIGLILNELITNAFKYAFPDGKTGSIDIALREQKGNLELKVSDDGIGLPKDFNERKGSLGFNLIEAFVKKLKATLKINGEKGTVVELTIPNAKFSRYVL